MLTMSSQYCFPGLILSAISLLINVLLLIYIHSIQSKYQKHNNSFPVIVDIFKEVRSIEFKEHLDYIQRKDLKNFPATLGFHGLPDGAKYHVIHVSHFFDYIGLLVANKLIDKKLVIGFIGGTIQTTWKLLQPYIDHERQKGGQNSIYQQYFEYLAALVEETPPEQIINNLKLKKIPRTNPS